MDRRPEGKNVGSGDAQAHVEELLETQKAAMLQLTNERTILQQGIELRRSRLKTVQKELRRAEKSVERLTAMEIEVSKATNERELYARVAQLMEAGLTSDEILEKLQG